MTVRPPCWCSSRWAPTWRLHTNLHKFGENVSPHISHKKDCCDLNLGESLYVSTFFLFPDSRLNLLNGFDFLFWSILNGVKLKTSNTTRSPCFLKTLGQCAFSLLLETSGIKVAGNSFQHFPRRRFWWLKITTLYQLMPTIMVSKICPITGEHVGIIFVTQ